MTEPLLSADEQLALCQRELQTIYALDSLRDSVETIESFLGGCATIIRATLNPDLIQLITLDLEDCPAQHITFERWRPAENAALLGLISGALTGAGDRAGERLRDAKGEILVRPLRVRQERLGVLVIGRQALPWSDAELRLVTAICSQVDSAIAGLRVLNQLQSRNKELETIYRLDRLIDTTPDFNTALSAALTLLSETIGASWSFIMLYTADERELELRASSHDDLSAGETPVGLELRALARETVESGRLVRREQISDVVGAYIGIPLILKDQIIGVFGGANPPKTRGFGVNEVKMLRAIASQMDTALFEDRAQQHIRETFARYVSPNVVDLMLRTTNQDFLNVHRQELTMLFSDMRGFTSVSEELPADVVAQMLNDHLAAMTAIVREAGGTVDKFVGDEIVAFFGAPLFREDHALLAVRTAQAMQARHARLMAEWAERGLPEVAIGIGIGTGEVIVGNIGSAQMMNYTAIGPDVNLAARLCGVAAPHQILISEATYRATMGDISAVPIAPLELRHIANPVQAYSVE